jgi:hypothetical protein
MVFGVFRELHSVNGFCTKTNGRKTENNDDFSDKIVYDGGQIEHFYGLFYELRIHSI